MLSVLHPTASPITSAKLVQIESEQGAASPSPISMLRPMPIEHCPSHPFSKSAEVSIFTRKSLIGTYQIEIRFRSKEGLFALIQTLDPKEGVLDSSDPLPLKGLPIQISQLKEINQLKKFFKSTYLVPEYDIKGNYCQVSVRISGPGGGKSEIPFQPGLVLGSTIRCSTLEKMQQYVEAATKLQQWENQLEGIEREINALNGKIKDYQERGKGSSVLVTAWKAQIASKESLIVQLSQKISTKLPDIPLFEGFHQGVESPIDFHLSPIVVHERGFDTLQFHSSYVSMDSSISEIEESLNQSATANSLSGKVGWSVFGGRGLHASFNKAVSDRLFQIKQSRSAEGVLLIHAMVTTRHVRCFDKIIFDPEKLRNIITVMKQGGPDDHERYGITTQEDETKVLYLLTEAALGGSFTGLVTFLKETEFTREAKKKMVDQSWSAGGGGGLNIGLWSASAAFSSSNQSSSQSASDRLKDIAIANIQVEIMAQGAIPSFAPEIVSKELAKHLDIDPSKFQLNSEDDALAESITKGNASEIHGAVTKRRLRMANAQLTIQNTMRGLVKEREEQSIHSVNSVVTAYDNFSSQITSDKNCGVPIGFYYQVLTQERIQRELDLLEARTTGNAVVAAAP